jgi:hypothetical protein
MGKMKGNRLNTAANVGSFVTGRQQLGVQRTLAAQGAIQAQFAAAQLAQMEHQQRTAEYQQLAQWADAEVAAGRRTREDAGAYVAQYWFNHMHVMPEATTRITYGFGDSLKTLVNYGGPPAGWYPDPDVAGWARFYDGQAWTLQTATVAQARDIIRQQAAEAKALAQTAAQHAALQAGQQPREIWNAKPAISRIQPQSIEPTPAANEHAAPEVLPPAPVTPPPPPMPPAGWYPNGSPGLLGYWNGQGWTGDTRPE